MMITFPVCLNHSRRSAEFVSVADSTAAGLARENLLAARTCNLSNHRQRFTAARSRPTRDTRMSQALRIPLVLLLGFAVTASQRASSDARAETPKPLTIDTPLKKSKMP